MFRFAVHVTAVVPLKIAQTAITANSTNRFNRFAWEFGYRYTPDLNSAVLSGIVRFFISVIKKKIYFCQM